MALFLCMFHRQERLKIPAVKFPRWKKKELAQKSKVRILQEKNFKRKRSTFLVQSHIPSSKSYVILTNVQEPNMLKMRGIPSLLVFPVFYIAYLLYSLLFINWFSVVLNYKANHTEHSIPTNISRPLERHRYQLNALLSVKLYCE